MKYYLLLIFFVMSPFHAYAQCYTPKQAEADQALRIHSELMVIGLNCQHMGQRNGMNLYADYRSFAENNAGLFKKYENTLMGFYKENGKSPTKEINNIRTRYANDISKSVSKIRPDVFCAKYAGRIEMAKKMSQDDIKKWASTFHTSHPVSYPLCEG